MPLHLHTVLLLGHIQYVKTTQETLESQSYMAGIVIKNTVVPLF